MKNNESDSVLETKALYNSLRMLEKHMEMTGEEPWKTTDFRKVELDALFDELQSLGILFTKPLFYQWAAHCETPEELVEILFTEEEEADEDKRDHTYLLLFELWRRLVPEKRSLSVIADEIDYVIFSFDSGVEVTDETIETAILEWVRIVQNLQDEGFSVKEALSAIEPYFAHSVKEFIIDFLLDMSDKGETDRYLPLFDKVRPFLSSHPLWVKILELKLCLKEDILLLNKKLGDLVAHLLTTPQIDSEIIFSVCDIALDLDRGELLLRLLERIVPDLQSREEVEIVIDLFSSYVDKKHLEGMYHLLAEIEEEKKTKPLSFLKGKLGALLKSPGLPSE